MGLFTPDWMKKDERTAVAAAEKLERPGELIRAATKAPLWQVRKIAIDKTHDVGLLSHVASRLHEEDVRVRAAALHKLGRHQEAFSEQVIYAFRYDGMDWRALLDGVNDGKLLAKIIMACDDEIAAAALERMEQGEALTELKEYLQRFPQRPQLLMQACEKLGDEEGRCKALLERIKAMKWPDALAFVRELDDMAALAYLLLYGWPHNTEFVEAALSGITQDEQLAYLMEKLADHPEALKRTAMRIKADGVLTEIAGHISSPAVCKAAETELLKREITVQAIYCPDGAEHCFGGKARVAEDMGYRDDDETKARQYRVCYVQVCEKCGYTKTVRE